VQCELLHGDGTLEVRLPGRPTLFLPRKTKPVANPERAIREALARPIGSAPFAEAMRTSGKVAIVVNDETRIARSEVFLPILVGELNRIGS
jgi:nickel-dependent lactate racemase